MLAHELISRFSNAFVYLRLSKYINNHVVCGDGVLFDTYMTLTSGRIYMWGGAQIHWIDFKALNTIFLK